MFVWILEALSEAGVFQAGASPEFARGGLIIRVAAAFVTAALATLAIGPWAIRRLRERFRERIDSASESLNRLHATKASTPTMGGLIIVPAITVAVLVYANLRDGVVWITWLAMIAFACVGLADDWIKATTQHRGLTVRQKLVAQIVIAGCCGMALQQALPEAARLSQRFHILPTFAGVLFSLWTIIVVVAASNAVNLSDGLDGLASGCGVIAASVMAATCFVTGCLASRLDTGGAAAASTCEIAVVMASLTGALAGFLWFNRYPARVFMGDTGSLPIGALLGIAGLVARREPMLALACGVYMVETLSVLAQVGWFKATGTRLIRCSPLHNHFVLNGHSESRVVSTFWLAGMGCAIVAAACLWVEP